MACSVAIVPKKECQGLLKELQKLGIYERTVKCFVLEDENIGIPLVTNVRPQIDEFCIGNENYCINERRFILKQIIPPRAHCKMGTCFELEAAIKHLIKERGLNIDDLINEFPRSWEKYGSMVIFDADRHFRNHMWNILMPELWNTICDILNVTRIAVKSRISCDNFRTPKVELLYGSSTWVDFIDNRIKYSWDIEKTMFCAGNAPERHRISSLNCKGEVVVDLYAGIGYFTLPYLIHAGANLVHACEWNTNAVLALKYNLKQNNVADKCIIHEGDNRLVCPVKIADRVNLGLIPSSRSSWKTACLSLKMSGGVLHIHENVTSGLEPVKINSQKVMLTTLSGKHITAECQVCTDILSKSAIDLLDVRSTNSFSLESCSCVVRNLSYKSVYWKKIEWKLWALHVCHSISEIMYAIYNPCVWNISVIHLYSVKSYGPHINHLVLDLQCSPSV